jgi:hypothetical protein
LAVKKPDSKTIISDVAATLNSVAKKHNFQVAPTQKLGKPSKTNSTVREFRLQLINTGRDTSEAFKAAIMSELKKSGGFTKITFNSISPNSSKYPSVSFIYEKMKFDAVIAKGANKGENFEKKTISDLAKYFKSKGVNKTYKQLVEKLTQSNPAFGVNEITSVTQRTGSTKKEGVATADLGAIIGDIVVKDSGKNTWYISLKDVNGSTFSSYSGAASLFDATGTLQPDSAGAKFLNSFGVDLNKVQKGFDERNNIKKRRATIPVSAPNKTEMKAIFERAWGMNYFYVRKINATDWKVFWMSRAKLNSLADNMTVTKVNYPNPGSKQITIYCSTPSADYTIELRNSKAQEYPNDTKFKITRLK